MEQRIKGKHICKYCRKEKESFTYWPCNIPGRRNLLCDDCSEKMLTPEAHKERTGLKSYKEMWISKLER
jgi:hypothetical protein